MEQEFPKWCVSTTLQPGERPTSAGPDSGDKTSRIYPPDALFLVGSILCPEEGWGALVKLQHSIYPALESTRGRGTHVMNGLAKVTG